MILTLTRTSCKLAPGGQFAEMDKETGFNNFELRMYDSRIGRWLSTDPNAQFYSPYVGMGNDPVSMIDPDGGFAGGGDPPSANGGWLNEVVVNATKFSNIGHNFNPYESYVVSNMFWDFIFGKGGNYNFDQNSVLTQSLKKSSSIQEAIKRSLEFKKAVGSNFSPETNSIKSFAKTIGPSIKAHLEVAYDGSITQLFVGGATVKAVTLSNGLTSVTVTNSTSKNSFLLHRGYEEAKVGSAFATVKQTFKWTQ